MKLVNEKLSSGSIHLEFKTDSHTVQVPLGAFGSGKMDRRARELLSDGKTMPDERVRMPRHPIRKKSKAALRARCTSGVEGEGEPRGRIFMKKRAQVLRPGRLPNVHSNNSGCGRCLVQGPARTCPVKLQCPECLCTLSRVVLGGPYLLYTRGSLVISYGRSIDMTKERHDIHGT